MDITYLKTWIGKKESAQEHLTSAIVDRFGATFDLHCTSQSGAPAPSLIHLCLCPPTVPTSEIGPDGHPTRGGFLPPVPLPNRMWAGGEFLYKSDILIDDVITRRSTIKDVFLKEGRSGPLCFVIVEHNIYSGEKHALTEIHNIVYKEQPTNTGQRKEPQAAGKGAFSETLTPTSTLLFRYSALTFNGHRIHYDAPYTKEVENYPGLIVHGPLQATLLFHFAENIKAARPTTFVYRNLSTIFDTAPFTLNAENEGDGLKLWTAQESGPIAMEASASW